MAVPLCDHAASFKRPHSTISDSSTSSSGSQSSSALGPLSPALLSSTHCPWPADLQACFQEEEELEQEPGSPPSLRECTQARTVPTPACNSWFQGWGASLGLLTHLLLQTSKSLQTHYSFSLIKKTTETVTST